MTIKTLLTILIKLIGLIFILISLIFVIPGYVNLFAMEDFIYPKDILDNPDIAMSTSLIITDIIINIAIYYFFIYKTDLILKFLRIDSQLGEIKIGKFDFNLQKYTQITLAITSIILLVLSIPELIVAIIQVLRVKDQYQSLDSFGIIENSILSIVAIILMLFNDKISKFLTK